MTFPMTTDPITLATVWHGLQSTCREMRALVQRSAQSHIIALLGDISVGIWDARARTVAVPIGLPAQFLGGNLSVRYLLDDIGDEIEEGDVFIHNDPYHGYNTHLPDWGFFRPVFHQGKLLFFLLARGHQMDTGGSYPGGYYPNGYDIHAEGLCFPPIKVISRGKEVKDMWKLIWNNVRYPNAMKIDVAALIAATEHGEQRVHALLERYGAETVMTCVDAMIERSERAVRKEIERIPDGTYSGESATDDDGTELDVPVWVKCDVTVKGDEMTIDFSRSDAQRKGFVNHSLGPTYSQSMAMSFLFFDQALAEFHNEGSMHPIHVIAPEGSVVNPRYPATVGGAPISVGGQVAEAIVMALSKALPHKSVAAWGRRYGQYVFGADPRTGDPYVWCPFDPDGGAGATWGNDGHQAPSSGLAALGNVQRNNVEEAEIRFPWPYLVYEFRPDSMGHGKWRGAPGIHWAIRNEGPRAGLPTGNSDGERTKGPGAVGGWATPNGQAWIERNGERIPVHTHRMYWAETGDVLERMSGGGAGVGDPRERDPRLIEEDIRNGLISREVARDVYGLGMAAEKSATRQGKMQGETVPAK